MPEPVGAPSLPSTALSSATSSPSPNGILLQHPWEQALRAGSCDGTVFLDVLRTVARYEYRAHLLQQIMWGAYVGCQLNTARYAQYAQPGRVASQLIAALCKDRADAGDLLSEQHLKKVSGGWLKIRVLLEDVEDAVWLARQCMELDGLPLTKSKVEALAESSKIRRTWIDLRGSERHQQWAKLLACASVPDLERTALCQNQSTCEAQQHRNAQQLICCRFCVCAKQ